MRKKTKQKTSPKQAFRYGIYSGLLMTTLLCASANWDNADFFDFLYFAGIIFTTIFLVTITCYALIRVFFPKIFPLIFSYSKYEDIDGEKDDEYDIA